MANVYKDGRKNTTNTTTVTGTVKSIAADRMSFVIETGEYDSKNKVQNVFDIKVKTGDIPLETEYTEGQKIVCVGYPVPDMTNQGGTTLQAMFYTNKSASWEYNNIAIVSGKVVFARYVDEKNEDGTPKMKTYTDENGKTASKPKSPHFDIGIRIAETDETGNKKYVLHTVHQYDYKGDTKKTDRLKKLFKSFDKDSNPIYMTIITQPGSESCSVREVDGKEYTNFYCNHMGCISYDVEFLNDRVKEQGNEVSQPAAPAAPAAPAPAPAPSGFNAAPSPVVEDLDDELFIN